MFPRPFVLIYALYAARSGWFDRAFYLGVNPTLSWPYRTFPLLHYVAFGEEAGLQPNPEFSPNEYKRLNYDLSGVKHPFLHFIRHGASEARLTKDLLPSAGPSDVPPTGLRGIVASVKTRSNYAIVIHLYYHDLWEEFSLRLRGLDIEFDLFVSICVVGDTHDQAKAAVLADFPKAIVIKMPNHGRDIFPFLHFVNSGLLSGYRAVCKLHTKKSPHRQDGSHWRDRLISGLLRGRDTGEMLNRFAQHGDTMLWVADGQHYEDKRWWSINKNTTRNLLRRLEITLGQDPELSFPAGSMYWIKPEMIEMFRGIRLTQSDFEVERGQVDGTLAHAFERAVGFIALESGHKILQTHQLELEAETSAAVAPPNFVTAFYLPQFHPIPENDAWWGKGYTEWQAAARAQPNLPLHNHPYLPDSLGFYDLRQTDVLGEQSAMARAAGIDAFCVYFYWFDGARVLEKPIDNLMDRQDVDFPFYLCWANESWRRNWDGLSGDVLMSQTYSDGFEASIASDLAPYFEDKRYQRPDGKRPRFVIYRPEDLPDPETNIDRLRDAWRQMGIGEVEIGAVRFHVNGETILPDDVVDFWIEMPPHGLVGNDDFIYGGPSGNLLHLDMRAGFRGLVYDYRAVVRKSCEADYFEILPSNTIAGVMPSWDNTARRGLDAHFAFGSNPLSFRRWVRDCFEHRIPHSYRNELFLNAWNEWAEKAVLEPSQQYGSAYLDVFSDEIQAVKRGYD
ncbi:MAG: glycoside hydrolase family 99-like domain-containing protein [Paracoccaceae bacterium]